MLAPISEKKQNDYDEVEFLDETNKHEKVILTSYPRSGNTLLRSYIEKITKIFTGSDGELKRKLNRELMVMGLEGESESDNKVWVVKTHYPERMGRRRFVAQRCIVVVRSPLDAIFSLYNMIGTVTHNKSLTDSVFEASVKENLW